MNKIFWLILLLSFPAFAQEKFELKNASKSYDVKIEVAGCADGFCEGAATFALVKKGETEPFQTFKVGATSLWLDKSGEAQANTTLLYDEQSAVNFGDFNFDGVDDLAVCDGTEGGYGMPSYQIYLFSKTSGKFVHSTALSDLNHNGNLGMMEVDSHKKVLRIFSKSGCCWHQTEEYRVVSNRPRKVFVEIEDATIADEKKVKITAKRFVRGRWQTSVKYVKREQ